jgi:hypothetical protein
MGTALDPAWQASAEAGRQHGAVNFDDLLEHYFAAFPQRRKEGLSEKEVAEREAGFREMLATFEEDEGRVRSQTWCPRIESGALLTAKRPKSDLRRALSGDKIRYFAGGNPVETDADLKLGEMMARADREAQRVADLLSNQMRGNALKQLYEVRATALEGFEAMARRRSSGEAVAKLRTVIERQVATQLKAAIDYAERAMRLRAAVLFQLGMLSGVVILLVFATFLLATFNRVAEEGRLIADTGFIPTALVLGGLGAVISVLQRITRGQVTTTLENGLTACFLLGVFRPVIGSVLAFAIVVLILGEIVPIDVPEAAGTRAFFLGGIAFLAGFSERYAQTMIGAARTGASPLDETTTTATTTTTTTQTDSDTDAATDAATDTDTATDTGTDARSSNGSGGAADGHNGSGGEEILVGAGTKAGTTTSKKGETMNEDDGGIG